uniref:Uncharacterized protein n=1 Tax=Magallana gigas TaxID=29159 RepID=K1PH36_MAGGI
MTYSGPLKNYVNTLANEVLGRGIVYDYKPPGQYTGRRADRNRVPLLPTGEGVTDYRGAVRILADDADLWRRKTQSILKQMKDSMNNRRRCYSWTKSRSSIVSGQTEIYPSDRRRKGEEVFTKWSLILDAYHTIRKTILNNHRAMSVTDIQLPLLNRKTLQQWFNEKSKDEEKKILVQGLALPTPKMTVAKAPEALPKPTSLPAGSTDPFSFNDPPSKIGRWGHTTHDGLCPIENVKNPSWELDLGNHGIWGNYHSSSIRKWIRQPWHPPVTVPGGGRGNSGGNSIPSALPAAQGYMAPTYSSSGGVGARSSSSQSSGSSGQRLSGGVWAPSVFFLARLLLKGNAP